MKVHLPSDSAVTLIDNVFIDQYMPGANGEFVKLYLYLLRCAGSGKELSVSSIADFFDHTEKDVRRALAYWEKAQLLSIQYDSSDNITDIAFLSGDRQEEKAAPETELSGESAGAPRGQAMPGETDAQAPSLPSRSISPARRRALREQEDIRQLIFVQQQYVGRPLTSAEVNNLLYFYEKLHFSMDLIDYLIDYCASKGNPGTRYMEKVAQEWYLAGVVTVADARKAAEDHNESYGAIFRALGLSGRKPAPAETRVMDRWEKDYGMPRDIILEACTRTIAQTHQPSFEYVDGILKSWMKSGVRAMEDIRKLDEEHQQQKQAAAGASGAGGRRSSQRRKGGTANAGLIEHNYDWSSLEQQLLQAQLTGGEVGGN